MVDQQAFMLGEKLDALEPAEFGSEDEFQELLARHPRILDFGTLADGQPLRLALVAREMGLSCRFRGLLTSGDERNTPYPGYVSTAEGTKRMNLDTACDLQGYGLGCSVSKRP